ncbi:asparagine synthase C-terminal domain-containing protein (plasmid) [Polymorphobacter sp. PAMC 29334]|uniref:asparagine synthase-related protein n=1 Tax=Polymorphobacter sp. PAMC 29334 TaxID=2862331 RepID=UPI001C778A91|nr:asparagine synthase C-terminal domain-containing protein [Polymorphobacter sp. PAMC 29334]QYE33124.1 asparagine synthase C-terminal domain-containing protein [Polymorphobacter sp. PAMC 29334]
MDFAAAYWPFDDPAGAAVGVRLRIARPPGWRIVVDLPGAFVAVDDDLARNRIGVPLDDGRGVIIGQLFDRAATEAGTVATVDPSAWRGTDAIAIGQKLLRQAWGAYVVIVPGLGHATLDIVRDPLGAQDCVTWQAGPVRLVASGAAYPADIAPPSPLAIDWATVALQLTVPVRVSEAVALTAMVAVEPGSLCQIADGRIRQRSLWRPADYCSPLQLPTPAALEQMIDACVAAWASSYMRPVAELSGGLDSSIVASALQQCPTKPVHWFTYFGEAPEADERSFARATALRLDLALTEVARSTRALVSSDFESLAAGLRPGMAGMDIHHDRDLAERADDVGADAIFTGQGGDAVFFQMPTAAVAADILASGASPIAFARAAIRAAHWTRSSVWSVAALALARRFPFPPPRPASFVRCAPGDHHLWFDGCESVPPAKRLQIFGLANSRVYFGTSLRSRRCDLVHPLLSQPLVELVLATPIAHLTGGDRDRRLARDAFAGRLPPSVTGRHGKGDLTAYYGRLVARSRQFLQEYLCEGHLAVAGLIDRRRLKSTLEPDNLATCDAYTEILSAALIESWLRMRRHD